VLYNGMIAPILNMRVRGATWYQGESNAGNATNYACRFPAMINDWRNQFNNPDLYFAFVLLAAYKAGGAGWPTTRDAQLVAMRLPAVGVGSAQDLGDEASPQGAIHPRNKSIVGERLSLPMQHDIYGQNVVSVGPMVQSISWPDGTSSIQTVTLKYDASQAYNKGLQIRDTGGCDLCCRNAAGSAFTIMTSDNMRRRANATVNSDISTVSVSVDLTTSPRVTVTAVQLNYEPYPQCALYNSVLIPNLPFNTVKPAAEYSLTN